MSAPSNKGARNNEAILIWSIIGAVVFVLAVFFAGFSLSRVLVGEAVPTSNPVEAIIGTATGEYSWSVLATVVSVVAVVLVVALAVVLWRFLRRGRGKRSRVDPAAAHMASGGDLSPLMERQSRAKAEQMGVDAPGLPIGLTMQGKGLYSSWEDMCIDIWGPRTGKTTSRAIPGILAAPGAVLGTSNKRDLVDATRGPRSEVGEVWVFDPQAVAEEAPSWWWNPLSYVTDEVKAQKLAGHFASGSRPAGARADAFFDSAGKDLLSGFLLAAALDKQPITRVYRWLTRESDDEAVGILRDGGYVQMAQSVDGVIQSPDKQRGGVFGTARQMASCLTNRGVLRWITPDGDRDARPQFDPATFVQGRNTLFALSKEGAGTAGPLVTALTVATVEAGEELAVRQGGRLRLPMVGMLDEAANVCRWADLPDLYSHYGSRGIVLCTILQSWSQGVDVWTESGMRKLWSAANVKVYGGGVAEAGFLKDMSELVGTYRYSTVSRSSSRQGVSRSWDDDKRESILEVSDLSSMPRGRALLFASGIRPAMIRTQPWMIGPDAEAIRGSIREHAPKDEAAV